MAHRPHIIAVASQKGGVGKSTTAVNLATALAAAGRPVLLVDCDPQGNASATVGFGLIEHGDGGTHQLLLHGAAREGALWQTRIPNLAVAPAGLSLAGIEADLAARSDSHTLLSDALRTLPGAVDYVVIDCPPSLGLLTINALMAAERVLVPLPCDLHALQSLHQLDHNLTCLAAAAGQTKPLIDILLTRQRREGDTHGSQTLAATVRRTFGDQVLTTEIPMSHELAAAAALGKPVLLHRPRAEAAGAYIALAVEMVQRLQDHEARAAGRTRGRFGGAATIGRWDPVASQMAIATRLIGWVTNPASPFYDAEVATEHQAALRASTLAEAAERSFGLRRPIWIALALVLASLMLGPILFFTLARMAPMDWRLKAVASIVGARSPWDAGTVILAQADPRAQKLLLLAATLAANPSPELADCLDHTDFTHGPVLPRQMPCLIALTVTAGLSPQK
jgi:chromosome partitioning protein